MRASPLSLDGGLGHTELVDTRADGLQRLADGGVADGVLLLRFELQAQSARSRARHLVLRKLACQQIADLSDTGRIDALQDQRVDAVRRRLLRRQTLLAERRSDALLGQVELGLDGVVG